MINFAAWAPDIAKFNTEVAADALNVIPCSTGYQAFRTLASSQVVAESLYYVDDGYVVDGYVSLVPVGLDHIPVTVTGAFSANIAGTIVNLCGTATALYRLTSDGTGWEDISRVSGPYTAPDGNAWRFTVFGDYIAAVNGADNPQKIRIGVNSVFSDLADAPVAKDVAVVGDFLVVQTEDDTLAWSGINDILDWAMDGGASMSDTQTFPDGGQFIGITGGRDGLVYHETCIRRMSFEGPPRIFRFDKLSENVGCKARGSIAVFENSSFFLSNQGFRQLSAAGSLDPIGSERVDEWFASSLDSSMLSLITATIDPARKLYVLGFSDGSSAYASQIILYHWPTAKWAHAEQAHQIVYSGIPQAGYTIDGLDALSDTIDGLEIPVDSPFYLGTDLRVLSAFTTSGTLATFAGATAEAVIETGDAQLAQGRKTMLRGLRPMVEGTSVTPELTVLYRDRLQDNHAVTGSRVPANAYGYCPVRVNARYHRARITIPAGSEWSFATGIDDLKLSGMGTR
jgi:hypothetical protein